MSEINRSEYEERLTRISDILAGIVRQAEQQSLTRCPYKNAQNQCTAKFGCRFQRKPKVEGELLLCSHDDQLDYRTAWETEPGQYDEMREKLQASNSRRDAQVPHSTAGTVVFGDRECPTIVGNTIFGHADLLEVPVPTSCGRVGFCHECVVEIREGMDSLSPRTPCEEFLGDNYRLACQAVVDQPDQNIEFGLLRRNPKILTSQNQRRVVLDPTVTRQGDRVFYETEPIDEYRGRLMGLAVDVGTTTVVAELLDLESGDSLFVSSFENPQRFGGSDVLHRISYDAGKFQGELHRAIINSLNSEIVDMCRQLRVSRHAIYEILVVGNATMRDLVFGLDVQLIGQTPYKSNVELEYLAGKRDTTSLVDNARKLQIYANKNARVVGAPLIASHVGADMVADLVAIDIESLNETMMLVDIGTNTEVVIGNKDRLVTASCPAGPAFEGGLVRWGLPGCDGAIEKIQYVNQEFQYETIGDVPPSGICGSGLIELLAELRRHDLMTPKGVFADKATQFSIVPEYGITFSRQDASHLAQAKAANYCGQMILMRHCGINVEDIDRLYLAGGFANYVDAVAAVEIGFLAPVPADRVEKVGNAALQGARELILSKSRRQSIEKLIATIEHIELETTEDFFEMFVEGCQFKPMEDLRDDR